MASDPLKEFRSRLAKEQPAEPARAAGDLLVYQAFDAKDKVTRLDIHRAGGPSHALPYAYLLDVIYSRRFYNNLLLLYRFIIIEVKGDYLRDVVLALKDHRADFIQEYHSREFERPADDAPIIRSIRIVAKDMADVISAADSEFDEA